MTRTHLFLYLFLSVAVYTFPQAGNGVYRFLELPTSSHLAALGSTNVSLTDNDISFSLQNPALLNSNCHHVLSLNSANYVDDINFGSVGYARSIDSLNTVGIGIQYVDYGRFKGYTEINTPTGDFTAKDYALNIVYSRKINKNIFVGATFKPLFSNYEMYTSYGVAMDAGAVYKNDAKLYTCGFAIRNLGTQIKGYYSDVYGQHLEPLPLNIEFGFSKKFTHAPLRFSITMQNLQQWDFSYESTNQPTSLLENTDVKTEPTFYDNTMDKLNTLAKHAVIAFEFVPTKNFYATVAYNHRRQEELRSDGFKSMSGFSYGAGIKVFKFQCGFGMNQILTGNQAYYFSINTSLSDYKL